MNGLWRMYSTMIFAFQAIVGGIAFYLTEGDAGMAMAVTAAATVIFGYIACYLLRFLVASHVVNAAATTTLAAAFVLPSSFGPSSTGMAVFLSLIAAFSAISAAFLAKSTYKECGEVKESFLARLLIFLPSVGTIFSLAIYLYGKFRGRQHIAA